MLVLGGALEEHALLRVLAEKLRLPTVDLSEFDPARAPVDAIPEPIARRLQCVPIGMDDRYLFVAVPDVPDAALLAELKRHTDHEVRPFLAPAGEIEALLRRIHGEEYSRVARFDLLERFPESSAHRILSSGQKGFLIGLGIVALLGAALFFVPTLIVAFAVASIVYTANSAYKLVTGYAALDHRYESDATPEELAALDERTLPVYTILVPLFREAGSSPRWSTRHRTRSTTRAASSTSRLLCEEDDDGDDRRRSARSTCRPHFQLRRRPRQSQPKTKPKACNYGLQLGARGEFVVIYDAEDRPDPDQLKKAVLAVPTAPTTTSSASRPSSTTSTRTQNLLTRVVHASSTRLLVRPDPAGARRGRTSPIPLGGTSNHFRTDDAARARRLGPVQRHRGRRPRHPPAPERLPRRR